MKPQAFRDMTVAELELKIVEFRSNLFKLTVKHNTKQLENTSQIPVIKKDIARALTIINEKKSKEAAANGLNK